MCLLENHLERRSAHNVQEMHPCGSNLYVLHIRTCTLCMEDVQNAIINYSGNPDGFLHRQV